MFSLKQLIQSLKYASKGFRFVFAHEQNFRIQILVALLVLLAMLYFRITGIHAVMLIFSIVSVLVLEVVNSVFEHLIDLLKPRLHYVVGEIKNMMAAAVLLASVSASLVGAIIFWPYLLGIIQRFSL